MYKAFDLGLMNVTFNEKKFLKKRFKRNVLNLCIILQTVYHPSPYINRLLNDKYKDFTIIILDHLSTIKTLNLLSF